MALRLGKLFGTSPEFWLNLQRNVDLWDSARGLKREIARIQPLQVAQRCLVLTAGLLERPLRSRSLVHRPQQKPTIRRLTESSHFQDH